MLKKPCSKVILYLLPEEVMQRHVYAKILNSIDKFNSCKLGKFAKHTVRVTGVSALRKDDGQFELTLTLTFGGGYYARVVDFKDGRKYKFKQWTEIDLRKLFKILGKYQVR